jgi:hypothetical protein
MHRPGMISIWYFIGILLSIYGVLITGASLYELVAPPAHPVVLYELHAGIWWGAFMLILGGVYTYFFSPRRQK